MSCTESGSKVSAAPSARPKLHDYLSMVKFSHSVFALPFAIISLLLATQGRPGLLLLVQVLMAAVAARTAAMAFNRYVDRGVDAENPRTAVREIPAGRIRPGQALGLTIVSSVTFVGISFWIHPLCAWLSPAVLFVLLGYSYTKRFTWACHLVLGLALGLAPLGAWIAATGSFDGILGIPLLLALAVLTWVAGFDVIYSCQDEDFDRGLGLHSLPEHLGIAGALRVSSVLHVLTLVFLIGVGILADLSWFWWLGVFCAGAILIHEHRLVKPTDLSRVNAAFFTMNGILSLVLALLLALDLWFLGAT